QQQQHPAVASSSGLSAVVPTVESTTVTVVDRLKHQLLQAYDNVSAVVQCYPPAGKCITCDIIVDAACSGDTEQATDVIIKLEKSNLTKELLEGSDSRYSSTERVPTNLSALTHPIPLHARTGLNVARFFTHSAHWKACMEREKEKMRSRELCCVAKGWGIALTRIFRGKKDERKNARHC
ncbi:unnamed protein product, partial [Onchocerca flexuosa]|uniref:CUE domain-containing protein n=1 Tax=Onchocerca flexuosa TaxID=387005 RepID=A0A183HKM0_9BILA